MTPRATQDEIRKASELLEESADELYEDAPCGYLSTLPDGTIVKVNRTLEAWTGHRREDLVGSMRFQDLVTAGGRIYLETHYRPLLLMQGSVREIALDLACADGRRLPVLVNSTLRRDAAGQVTVVRTTVFDATDRRAYELELLRSREHADRLRRHSGLLAESSRLLDEQRGVEARARALVDLLVAEVCAGAVLEVAGEDGLVAAAGKTDDPALAGALRDALTGERARDPEPDTDVPQPVLALPLTARGRRLGALAVVAAADSDTFRAGDVPLLEAIADRAAVALENAHLYERERNTALTLQRAMLAGPLPADPRFEIGTSYSPAVDTLEIGGDWYDAFLVGPDHITVVVGDVVGKGLDAAATMGQLRSALRAIAFSGITPASLLAQLDQFVEHTDPARGATVAVARVDLASGSCLLACAGHPPPILLPPTGEPQLVWDGRSPPLGLYPGIRVERGEATIELEPGARLLLYSDGVVERRQASVDRGMDRLMDAFGRRRHEPVDRIAAALDAELQSDEHRRDDVCMLVLALTRP